MKIAIMGAGLSGLTCAITLELYGVMPTIFEKRSKVGDRFVNSEILLATLQKPQDDSIAYLTEKHQIFLQPIGNIKTLNIYSEHEQATVCGQLGFVNVRGREQDSFENQLARQVKTRIHFNSKRAYEELLEEFTHVVLATGDAAYAAKIQPFQYDFTVTLHGATVTGQFERFSVATWLDNRFAPKGYSYFIPLSEREANIVIAYPDYPENQAEDIRQLWDGFYQRVRADLKQNLKITDRFEITRYPVGTAKYPRIGNTFFVGNCLNSIMPFLGFGQFAAMLTGIYAAHDLLGLGKYADLVKPIRQSYENSLTLRRAMENLNNTNYDYIVKKLQGPWGRRIFDQNKFDYLKVFSYLLRPWAQRVARKV